MVRVEATEQAAAVDDTDDGGPPLGVSGILVLQSRCLALLEEDDIEGLGPILHEIFRLMHDARSLSTTERDKIRRSHEELQKAIDVKTEDLRQQVEMAASGRRAAGRYGAHRAPTDE